MSKIMTALIDAGFPAKRHLFEPLAGKENLKVWPKSKEAPGKPRPYCIVKGEEYKVSPEYTGGELFGGGELKQKKATDVKVSSNEKTDSQ